MSRLQRASLFFVLAFLLSCSRSNPPLKANNNNSASPEDSAGTGPGGIGKKKISVCKEPLKATIYPPKDQVYVGSAVQFLVSITGGSGSYYKGKVDEDPSQVTAATFYIPNTYSTASQYVKESIAVKDQNCDSGVVIAETNAFTVLNPPPVGPSSITCRATTSSSPYILVNSANVPLDNSPVMSTFSVVSGNPADGIVVTKVTYPGPNGSPTSVNVTNNMIPSIPAYKEGEFTIKFDVESVVNKNAKASCEEVLKVESRIAYCEVAAGLNSITLGNNIWIEVQTAGGVAPQSIIWGSTGLFNDIAYTAPTNFTPINLGNYTVNANATYGKYNGGTISKACIPKLFSVVQVPAPTVMITNSPSSVPYNTAASIAFTSTNANNCTWSVNGASNPVALSGTAVTGALTSNTSVVFTCYNASGSGSASASISVALPPRPTVSITSYSSEVGFGSQGNITFTSTDATWCTWSVNGNSNPIALSGTAYTPALKAYASVSVTCNNVSGSASTAVGINVWKHMFAPTILYQDEQFKSSDNRFMLTVQGNGNLALLKYGSQVLWHSNTYNNNLFDRQFRVQMQYDGNLVLKDPNGAVQWSSGTYMYPGAYLKIQNDGNLVIYDKDGIARWDTGTYGQ